MHATLQPNYTKDGRTGWIYTDYNGAPYHNGRKFDSVDNAIKKSFGRRL